MLPLIAVFVTIALITFIVGRSLLRLNRDPISERLAAFVRENDTQAELRPTNQLIDSLADQLPHVKMDNGILDRELRQGGFYSPTAKVEYLAIRNGVVIGTIIITGILAVAIGPERQDLVLRVLFGGFIIACVAWAVPRVILRAVVARRLQRIAYGLPYALDMITMCTAGGITLRDALVHVGKEIYLGHPDLAIELVILRQHAELNSLDFALRQFSARINMPEITAVAALVSHTHRLGVNAASTLQEYADIIRQKWRQEADERANSASVKLLFPLALCLMPSAMMLLWGPAAIELTKFLQGGMGAVQSELRQVP
jgi:tight adherence protein C